MPAFAFLCFLRARTGEGTGLSNFSGTEQRLTSRTFAPVQTVLQCPECGHAIPVSEALSHQIAEQARAQSEAEIASLRSALKEQDERTAAVVEKQVKARTAKIEEEGWSVCGRAAKSRWRVCNRNIRSRRRRRSHHSNIRAAVFRASLNRPNAQATEAFLPQFSRRDNECKTETTAKYEPEIDATCPFSKDNTHQWDPHAAVMRCHSPLRKLHVPFICHRAANPAARQRHGGRSERIPSKGQETGSADSPVSGRHSLQCCGCN